MSRVLVTGACGRMGERVRYWLDAHDSLECGGALEAPGHPQVGETVAPGVVVVDDAKAATTGMVATADAPKAVAAIAIKAAEAAAGFAANDRGDFCGPATNPDCMVMFAKLFALPYNSRRYANLR